MKSPTSLQSSTCTFETADLTNTTLDDEAQDDSSIYSEECHDLGSWSTNKVYFKEHASSYYQEKVLIGDSFRFANIADAQRQDNIMVEDSFRPSDIVKLFLEVKNDAELEHFTKENPSREVPETLDLDYDPESGVTTITDKCLLFNSTIITITSDSVITEVRSLSLWRSRRCAFLDANVKEIRCERVSKHCRKGGGYVTYKLRMDHVSGPTVTLYESRMKGKVQFVAHEVRRVLAKKAAGGSSKHHIV